MHKILFVIFMAMPICSHGDTLFISPSFPSYRGMERQSIGVEREIEQVPIQCVERRALCFESLAALNKFLSVNRCDDCDLLDVERNQLKHIVQVEHKTSLTVEINDGYGWIAEPIK